MDSPIRALLFPASEAARYSTRHALNAANVRPFRRKNPPLDTVRLASPNSSNGEDLEEITEGEEALVLQQTVDLHCFSFGSDLNNFFVLKDDPKASEAEDKVCYFNLHHCQFYPDPDSPDVWLKNTSTSELMVKSTNPGLEVIRIEHAESAPIRAGWWHVTLGEGLQFVLEVFSLNTPASSTKAEISPSLTQRVVQMNARRDADKQAATVVHTTEVRKQAKSDTAMSKTPQDIKKMKSKPGTLDTVDQDSSKAALLSQRNAPNAKAQSALQGRSTKTQELPKLDKGKQVSLEHGQHQADSEASKTIGKTLYSRVEKQLRGGKYVAVKMARRPEIPVAADLWLQEDKILKMVAQHRNVVQFFSSNATKREIVMEYIPGQSVDKFSDHAHFSVLSEEQCHNIWQGAAEALAWIHGLRILHNDIKPGNMMYDPQQQRLVLVDFGLAAERTVGRFTQGGTPWYLPPEYLVRERSYPADIWALAIVMLFCFKLRSLPEATEKAWNVFNVLDTPGKDRLMMAAWFSKIQNLREKITRRNRLIHLMLELDANDRISAKELAQTLRNEKAQMLLIAE